LSQQSPRSGLLTYQEFGCPNFERRDSEDDDSQGDAVVAVQL
jgi:hypothetical protein